MSETERQKFTDGAVFEAGLKKWPGWTWQEYQRAMIRSNHYISRMDAERTALVESLQQARATIDRKWPSQLEDQLALLFKNDEPVQSNRVQKQQIGRERNNAKQRPFLCANLPQSQNSLPRVV